MNDDNQTKISKLKSELSKLQREEREQKQIAKLEDELYHQKHKGSFFYELRRKLGF